MRLKSKLTLILLVTSLTAVLTVGGVASWFVKRDFRQLIMDQAFLNFQSDMQGYIAVYGGLENAQTQEAFSRFVRRTRREANVRPIMGPLPLVDRDAPPFHFLTFDNNGFVLRGLEDYPVGSKVTDVILKNAKPITYEGKTVMLAYPIGEPVLSNLDKAYLSAMQESLVVGTLVALLLAIIIGLLTGHNIVTRLAELTRAIRQLQSNKELQQQISVRSKDELGELALAFNDMNSELVSAHKELRELSVRDPLTQLYNRRYFDREAPILFEKAKRYHHPLSVMLADIDHFKQVNDNFSHTIGDEVLRYVAEQFSQGIRAGDVVARYGGEEFIILFPNTDLAQSITCCEKLRKKIAAYPWQEIQPELQITISMGLCDNLDQENIAAMIASADKNLYAAKDAGRNCIIPAVGSCA